MQEQGLFDPSTARNLSATATSIQKLQLKLATSKKNVRLFLIDGGEKFYENVEQTTSTEGFYVMLLAGTNKITRIPIMEIKLVEEELVG